MKIDDIKAISVIGAGDMGHGIAEVALIAGYKVYLRDIKREFVDRGLARIHQSLEKLVAKGKVTAEHHNEIRTTLLVPCVDIGEAVRESDLVIEAIPEIMDYTGLDINLSAANYFAQEVHPDFAAGNILTSLVETGDLGKKSGKGLFDWSQGRPEINQSKATDQFDPMDLVAVNANEATRIVDMGVCSFEDVDTAIINATGNPMGLIALVKNIEPGKLSDRLDGLSDRFKKEIFRPTRMIREGAYR